jgi:hypothetical protein
VAIEHDVLARAIAIRSEALERLGLTAESYGEHLKSMFDQVRDAATANDPAHPTLLDEWLAEFRTLRTPGIADQDPYTYAIAMTFWGSTGAAASRLGLHLPAEYLVATAPTGRINARVIPGRLTPFPAFIFDTDTLVFCVEFAAQLLAIWPMIGEGEQRTMSLDPEVASKFWAEDRVQFETLASMVLTTARSGLRAVSPPPQLNASTENLSLQLAFAIGVFVVGHEIGHVVSDHLSASPERAGDITFRVKEEIDADAIGMKIAMEYARNEAAGIGQTGHLALAAASAFFSYFGWVDRVAVLLNDGIDFMANPLAKRARILDTKGSHPHPLLRREALRFQAAEFEQNPRLVPVFQQFNICLDTLGERLFRMISAEIT